MTVRGVRSAVSTSRPDDRFSTAATGPVLFRGLNDEEQTIGPTLGWPKPRVVEPEMRSYSVGTRLATLSPPATLNAV